MKALEKDRTRRAFRLRRSWPPTLPGTFATNRCWPVLPRPHTESESSFDVTGSAWPRAAVLMALLVGLAGTAIGLVARGGVEAVAAARLKPPGRCRIS